MIGFFSKNKYIYIYLLPFETVIQQEIKKISFHGRLDYGSFRLMNYYKISILFRQQNDIFPKNLLNKSKLCCFFHSL